MMRSLLFSILALCFCPLAMWAAPKGGDTDDDGALKKGAGKVYIFGFSRQLADSVAYITDIQEVDSIDLQKKTRFLPYRSEFSLQMKEFLEGKLMLSQQTACVYFASKQKKLAKTHAKLKKRYINMDGMTLVTVKKDDFAFKHPIDSFSEQ